MAKIKMYAGNHPDASEGWTQLGEIYDGDGLPWAVYQQDKNKKGWSDVKVAVWDDAPNKGNYWLVWNGSRFAKSSELEKMETHRSALASELRQLMAEYAEPDADGYDLI
jgi:hypothetical protein